jgi:hypothetical protein
MVSRGIFISARRMIAVENIAGAEMAGWEAKNRKERRETGAQFRAIFYHLGPLACIAANDLMAVYSSLAGAWTY